jgi:signal transduction histidine kinase
MSPCALVVAVVVGLSGSLPLEGWEWAEGGAVEAPARWEPTVQPVARPGGREHPTLWLRTRAPAPEGDGESLSLLVGYMGRAFEVEVGGRRVFSYPGSRQATPWHLVPLPRDVAGEDLVLRLHAPPGGSRPSGFRWGIRVGSRADHYLWMLRKEWPVVALGMALLAVALVCFGAQVVARIRRQARPFGALGTLCATTALNLVPQHAGYLSALVLPRQDLLDATNRLTTGLSIAAEVWFMACVFRLRLRFGLKWLAWLLVALALARGPGVYLGLASHAPLIQLHVLLAIVTSVVILANVAAAWRSCSRAMRVVGTGLVVSELATLVELVSWFLGLFGTTVVTSPIGITAFLFFVLVSSFVVSSDAQAQEDRERELNARAHSIAQTTAMFAHDVRKPFAIMRMMLQSLRSARTMPEVASTLETASEEVEQVTRSVDEMITDILQLGAPAALPAANEELADCLLRVLERLARAGDARQVDLSFDLQHTRQLKAQRLRLERVLSNILGNALEAMGGRGHLWFRSRDVSRKGVRLVELTIGNSGPAIPQELVDRVFDPFFTSGKRGGTGLGLTIVRKLVESLGGEVACRTLRAVGVEFTFTVPAAELAASARVALPAHLGPRVASDGPAPEWSAPGVPYVVLVEDSRAVRNAWRKRLPEGSLCAFGSPSELLATADHHPGLLDGARFVILDNRFEPGEMDGVALGELLWHRTRTPLLLCSGVTVSPLPAWCSGQLSKDTYDFEGLAQATLRRRGEDLSA